MDIGIKLDRNFTVQLNKLFEKYGEELRKLNGISKEQLSFTDFIDNYVATDTVADASIDGSANVSHRDIVTLLNEMPKPHQKLLSLHKIHLEMQKKYGLQTANEWLESEFVGRLYLHDSHTSAFTHYCFSYDLKDLAEKGLYFIDGSCLKDEDESGVGFNSEPPKHLETFVDFVKEFVSWTCNRSSGAVGLANIVPYLYYFWYRDVKNNYMLRDPKTYAVQQIQRLVYALNQPFLRGGIQSSFTNFLFFDHEYLYALFGGATFPDGSYMVDEIEEIMDFQKLVLETISDIRSRNMMTFPVISISILKKDGKCVDEDFARWAVRHNMKWCDANFFVDDTVTSLSSCCFDGKQRCLSKSSSGVFYTTFEELYNTPSSRKRNFTVFHNGSWAKGKVVRLPARKLYKITTQNKKEIIVTDNHICPTLRGDVIASDLTTDDYLLFNCRQLEVVKERNLNLTYEQGYLIGMYLGDGSCFVGGGNITPTVSLSLNEHKYNASYDIVNSAIWSIDENAKQVLNKQYNNVFPVTVRSRAVYDFVKTWVRGNYCYEKQLNMDCLLQSSDFRRGVLDGYYVTDGGNSNRIYTTSEELMYQVECLMTSLGLNSVIDVEDRTDEPCIVRGKEYKRNYPLYCIRWYSHSNKRSNSMSGFKVRNNSDYFKISAIEDYHSDDKYVYCFEMEDQDEPYFTLPNGIITHNCRLQNNIENLGLFGNSKQEEKFGGLGYFSSIGGASLKVGSLKVGTINLARVALESSSEEEYIDKLKYLATLDLQMLDCVRHIIKRNVEKGLLRNFSLGLVDFEHLYNTIGFVGVFETMKKFGYTRKDEFGNTFYTKEAEDFGKKIFDAIHSVKNDFAKDKDYMVNIEQSPAETAAYKLMLKDKIFFGEDVVDDLPLYGNQFIPLGIKTTSAERVRIASLFDSFCNGGSILHYNIEAPFTNFEQAWDMFNYITDAGVTYFAFNPKIQACKHNHAFFGKVCPICGSPVDTEYSRVVGFFVPTKSYSKERKAEFKMRLWEDVNKK